MAYKSDPRGTRAVRIVGVHSAEGARTAASLGSYFWQAATQASSHVGIDAGATLQYVGYDRSAWTMRSANPVSDNAELCGFAHWTREQWLSTGTVDGCANPRAILDRTAAWIRSRCLARGIPIRKLTSAQVAAGQSGVIAHWDWTLGMHDGTHTDPGTGFPWDYVIAKASEGNTPTPPPPTPKPQSGVELMERITIPASPDTRAQRLWLPGGPNCKIVIRPPEEGNPEFAVWQGNIYAWASAPGNERVGIGTQYNPKQTAGFDLSIQWTREIPLPGALWADYEYSCTKAFTIDIYG